MGTPFNRHSLQWMKIRFNRHSLEWSMGISIARGKAVLGLVAPPRAFQNWHIGIHFIGQRAFTSMRIDYPLQGPRSSWASLPHRAFQNRHSFQWESISLGIHFNGHSYQFTRPSWASVPHQAHQNRHSLQWSMGTPLQSSKGTHFIGNPLQGARLLWASLPHQAFQNRHSFQWASISIGTHNGHPFQGARPCCPTKGHRERAVADGPKSKGRIKGR